LLGPTTHNKVNSIQTQVHLLDNRLLGQQSKAWLPRYQPQARAYPANEMDAVINMAVNQGEYKSFEVKRPIGQS
jgi:hypothetical protein